MKVFTSKTQQLGEKGEQAAVTYLKNQGLTIVERNVGNKFGEIDIVAKKGKVHYFFEVKAGKKESWFNPAENLTPAKLSKFLRSVEYYCLINKVADYRAQGMIVLFDQQGNAVTEVIDLS